MEDPTQQQNWFVFVRRKRSIWRRIDGGGDVGKRKIKKTCLSYFLQLLGVNERSHMDYFCLCLNQTITLL